MPDSPTAAFISYSREDSEFALRLAQDLRAAGASVWIDQLDIHPGKPWDNAIEDALQNSPQMLAVLSPTSVRSENVRDEISYALRQGKIVVPVLYMDCVIPLRLERKQYIDFRSDYARGLAALLHHLRIEHPNQSVLDKAAGDEAIRRAAWQAREAEARRLAGLKEQERLEDSARQKEVAERATIEEAERRAQEEADRKAREAAEQKAREDAAHKAAETEARRRAAEERKRREQEQEAQRQKEDAARKARDEAERKARETAERNARTGDQGTAIPLLLSLFQPKVIAAAVAVCIAILAVVAWSHWSLYAGVKWIPLTSGITNSLNSVTTSLDGRTVFACGATSPFLGSSDGGVTWESHEKNSNANCQALFITADGSTIWTTGFSLKLLESTNGGVTWTTASLPAADSKSSPAEETFQIALEQFFEDEVEAVYSTPNGERLWAAAGGGSLFGSSDSGAAFSTLTSGTTSSLYSIAGTSDSGFLVAVGAGGTILVSSGDAAGVRWSTADSGTQSSLRSVFVAADAKLLCAVGDSGTVRISTDKGITWTAGQSGVGASLHGVFGTSDGKHLWAVGTSGIIIQSDDSGATWKLRTSGTNFSLNAIFGTGDGKLLYVAGDNGTILQSKSGFH